MQPNVFKDRTHAGQLLATELKKYSSENPVLIALPRGGVPVAFEVARTLGVPMDVIVVRKLGAPNNPEFGVGAIAEDGSYWLNQDSLTGLGITGRTLEGVIAKERKELQRRIDLYRQGRPLSDLHGRTAILIDDGLATGVSALAAARYLRHMGAKRIILGVPVCSSEAATILESEVDEVICLSKPEHFFAVGSWYKEFPQLKDREVVSLLAESAKIESRVPESSESEVEVSDGRISLMGDLTIPNSPLGIIIFAHGSGSSRKSPRNKQVAEILNQSGFATLLLDLLTPNEASSRSNVFDIALLSRRLTLAVSWVKQNAELRLLPIGLFGASTGAAAALAAAAELKDEISAVVSRGGRPDLAADKLPSVLAPTLLLVGSHDEAVLELNQNILPLLSQGELIVIPGATHLFEEPGTLEQVASEAAQWFSSFSTKHEKKDQTAA